MQSFDRPGKTETPKNRKTENLQGFVLSVVIKTIIERRSRVLSAAPEPLGIAPSQLLVLVLDRGPSAVELVDAGRRLGVRDERVEVSQRRTRTRSPSQTTGRDLSPVGAEHGWVSRG
jgi:hypothetical protein